MKRTLRAFSLIVAIILCLASPVQTPIAARADELIATTSAPVVNIHSTGGTITIVSGDDGNVHLISPGPNVKFSRFSPNRSPRARVMLPSRQGFAATARGMRHFRMPARQFFVPGAQGGTDGISIDNPGGDLSIAIPRRVSALFINAESGGVNIDKLRGPFVIAANDGNVRLTRVFGRGIVRTLSGNIQLLGVGGDIHVQTASGHIVARASFAEKADVVSEIGPIDWRFARVGAGAYRFRSTQGPIVLSFRPGVAALVDVQSNSGSVASLFAPGAANVRFSSAHAMSLEVNGGGSEITAASTSGDITIAPVVPPPPRP